LNPTRFVFPACIAYYNVPAALQTVRRPVLAPEQPRSRHCGSAAVGLQIDAEVRLRQLAAVTMSAIATKPERPSLDIRSDEHACDLPQVNTLYEVFTSASPAMQLQRPPCYFKEHGSMASTHHRQQQCAKNMIRILAID
jgi:hypothetical protein